MLARSQRIEQWDVKGTVISARWTLKATDDLQAMLSSFRTDLQQQHQESAGRAEKLVTSMHENLAAQVQSFPKR
eukprot:4888114-Karenia_brevis.AAC.1